MNDHTFTCCSVAPASLTGAFIGRSMSRAELSLTSKGSVDTSNGWKNTVGGVSHWFDLKVELMLIYQDCPMEAYR